jgi:hypothetical protein
MRGFPNHINTAADLNNVAALYPKEVGDYQQKLHDGRFVWQDAGPVGDKYVVTETDTLKVVENKTGAGVIERRKLVLVEDQTAQFFKLGLKVAEVKQGNPVVTGK